MLFTLKDWITNDSDNIIDDIGNNIAFYTSIQNNPIILSVNNTKVIPSRILEITGINFAGNIAVKIGDTVVYINDNVSDTFISLKTPVNLPLGKIELKVCSYTVNNGVPELGADSNIVYLYSYENIESSVDDYCLSFYEKQYTKGVTDLIPPGKFARDEDSNNYKLNSVVADQLVDLNEQICDIAKEVNPLTTHQLLNDWEIELGLPEPCITTQNQDLETRKQEVRRKYLATGGNTSVYFEQMASLIGYTIEVEENTATLMNCESNCEAAVVDPSVLFVINILVFGVEQQIMNCESNCEAPIDWYGGEEIECFLNQIKPAHNLINLKYRIGSVLTTNDDKQIVTDEDIEILATF